MNKITAFIFAFMIKATRYEHDKSEVTTDCRSLFNVNIILHFNWIGTNIPLL